MTQVFDSICALIRARALVEGELQAVTAQGRFQGLVLSILPFALMAVLWFADRDHLMMLFTHQAGIAALGVVVLMVVMAQLWISKLLKIDV